MTKVPWIPFGYHATKEDVVRLRILKTQILAGTHPLFKPAETTNNSKDVSITNPIRESPPNTAESAPASTNTNSATLKRTIESLDASQKRPKVEESVKMEVEVDAANEDDELEEGEEVEQYPAPSFTSQQPVQPSIPATHQQMYSNGYPYMYPSPVSFPMAQMQAGPMYNYFQPFFNPMVSPKFFGFPQANFTQKKSKRQFPNSKSNPSKQTSKPVVKQETKHRTLSHSVRTPAASSKPVAPIPPAPPPIIKEETAPPAPIPVLSKTELHQLPSRPPTILPPVLVQPIAGMIPVPSETAMANLSKKARKRLRKQMREQAMTEENVQAFIQKGKQRKSEDHDLDLTYD